MNDSDPGVRLEAVVALGQSQRTEFIPALLVRLSDERSEIRRQAIMMLKGFRKFEDKREKIADAIVELLNDTDYRVRMWAALALGELGVLTVIPRLIAKLGDRQIAVKKAAAQSLGMLRDKKAIEPLINTMTSRDEALRESCKVSLEMITGVNLGEDPTDWQYWFEAGMPPVTPEKRSDYAPKEKPETKPDDTKKSDKESTETKPTDE